jgi:hypothetical protein
MAAREKQQTPDQLVTASYSVDEFEQLRKALNEATT